LFENIESPYLKPADKVRLTKESGLTRNQVLNWFINVRKVSTFILMKTEIHHSPVEQVQRQEKYQQDFA
jgi:hypothetical protein